MTQTKQALGDRLSRGLEAINLSLDEQQHQQLLAYLQLFDKWNRAYNLSSVRNIDDMLSRHMLDSLSIHPYFLAKNCLDVGSGGGLPGIPLAISYPDRQFTLLDSNGKKTRFLFQVANELGLKNVTVEQCRVEEKPVPPYFDGIVSRAFSTIDAMLHGSAQLLAEGGLVYAMKGRYPAEELAAVSELKGKTGMAQFEIENTHQLNVPGTDGDRHLIVLKRTGTS